MEVLERLLLGWEQIVNGWQLTMPWHRFTG
jgi:hypothetical protein